MGDVGRTRGGFPPIHVHCHTTKCPQVNEGNATHPGPFIPSKCEVPPWTCPQLAAARTLSEYLGNMSGGAVPVLVNSTASHPAGSPAIAVGFGAATALGVRPSVLAGLGNESLVVSAGRPGIPAGVFVVSGGELSQRGDTFAVFELLRRMGCRFLAYDMTMEEELGELFWSRRALPPSLPSGIDITFHPALDYRDTNEWAGTAKGHGNTSAALDYDGLNTPGIGEQQVEYAPPGFAHTSYALLSRSGLMSNHAPPELWNTHREWFCTNSKTEPLRLWLTASVRAGPRVVNATHNDNTTFGQLCWGNASMVEFMIQQMRRSLHFWTAYRPNYYSIVSVSVEDNGYYCNDTNEQRIYAEEGSLSGPLIRAVNTIAAALREEFPHVRVSTLACEPSEYRLCLLGSSVCSVCLHARLFCGSHQTHSRKIRRRRRNPRQT